MPTKKELQKIVRQHNATHCIKYSRLTKPQLQVAVDRMKKPPAKKRIVPMLISQPKKKKTASPRTKLLKSLAKGKYMKKKKKKMSGGGGTKGQKTTNKKLNTLATNIAKLKGADAYPELGF